MNPELPNVHLRLHRNLLFLFSALLMIGMGAFGVGLLVGKTLTVWTVLLINTLFFVGIAHGGLAFSVILTLTNATWGRPFKRLAESMGAFIPVGWLLFGFLFLGMGHLYEWMDPTKVLPAKMWWLNQNDFISRNSIALLLTGIIGLLYLTTSLMPDLQKTAGQSKKANVSNSPVLLGLLDWKIFREYSPQLHAVLAPFLGLAYALLSCLLAFDWIMSMDQTWFSAAFGVQYMVANLFAALALVMIIGSIARNQQGMKAYLTLDRFQDLSRFLLAVAMFWAYIVFSQVLVIWYANLPQETPFLVKRMLSPEWSLLFKGLFGILFLLPLVGLLTRRACRTPWFTSLVGFILLLGLWAEKLLLVVPSVEERILITESGFGILSLFLALLISLGILSAFLLTTLGALSKMPFLPISDPRLRKEDL